MIETPASVIMSYEPAQIPDLFSIGTNDLTRYTLAIDGQNSKLDSINDLHTPLFFAQSKQWWKMPIKPESGQGICGELGADTALTQTFLDYGADELSVSPSFVLPVRKAVTEAE